MFDWKTHAYLFFIVKVWEDKRDIIGAAVSSKPLWSNLLAFSGPIKIHSHGSLKLDGRSRTERLADTSRVKHRSLPDWQTLPSAMTLAAGYNFLCVFTARIGSEYAFQFTAVVCFALPLWWWFVRIPPVGTCLSRPLHVWSIYANMVLFV